MTDSHRLNVIAVIAAMGLVYVVWAHASESRIQTSEQNRLDSLERDVLILKQQHEVDQKWKEGWSETIKLLGLEKWKPYLAPKSMPSMP